jgi:hypothetical protein
MVNGGTLDNKDDYELFGPDQLFLQLEGSPSPNRCTGETRIAPLCLTSQDEQNMAYQQALQQEVNSLWTGLSCPGKCRRPDYTEGPRRKNCDVPHR